jgi:hypothetical protein
MRERIKDVAASRGLSVDDIKPAMTLIPVYLKAALTNSMPAGVNPLSSIRPSDRSSAVSAGSLARNVPPPNSLIRMRCSERDSSFHWGSSRGVMRLDIEVA